MELLGDVGHEESRFFPFGDNVSVGHTRRYVCHEALLEARFGPFGDSANLDARLVHGLRRAYHRLANHFGRTRWKS